MRPPVGLCVPVRYQRCRDGDTIEVSLPRSGYTIAVRLLDCWAPESSEPAGRVAKQFAEQVLDDCDDLHLFVPLGEVGPNILASLSTFDRVLGELWVSPTNTLNEMLVRAGHATREKGKKRGPEMTLDQLNQPRAE